MSWSGATTGWGSRAAAAALVLVAAAASEVRAQTRNLQPSLLPPAQQTPLPIGPGAAGSSLTSPGGPPAAPSATGAVNVHGGVPAAAGQVALALSARYGREPPAINGALHWRVYADRPDRSGLFRLVREERAPAPTFTLPPGGYVVHVSFGLASAAKRVQLRAELVREVFEIPAGGARFEGRVGEFRIPAGQVTFSIYNGSQFDLGDRQPVVEQVPSGDVVILPEGLYHVVSNYGDGNAVTRSDLRIRSGKLTDTTIVHRAARITLKLVSESGGEALASTAWSVLTPGGDVVKESIGAFPSVILAEGDYVAIARNDGRVYNRQFKVESGIDREVEVLAR